MKKIPFCGTLLMILFIHSSCETAFIKADPENTPVSNFELLWQDFDKTYPSFELKKINWDSVYDLYRPRINNATDSNELFRIVSDMLGSLKDGHVNLYADFGRSFNFDFAKGKPDNFLGLSETISKYVSGYENNKIIGYGKINSTIGYVYLSSFGSTQDTYEYIDHVINDLYDTKGIIIDVRNNGGGSTKNSDIIIGRFTAEKIAASYFRYKSGPKHSDMTDFFPGYNSPQGPKQFAKPVVILTNRRCFSAAEDFVLRMNVLTNVTVVGDTTGGGAGNPIYRELPNGWVYRVPRGLEYDLNKTTHDGVGLYPDVSVWINEADKKAGRDTILEKALGLLQ